MKPVRVVDEGTYLAGQGIGIIIVIAIAVAALTALSNFFTNLIVNYGIFFIISFIFSFIDISYRRIKDKKIKFVYIISLAVCICVSYFVLKQKLSLGTIVMLLIMYFLGMLGGMMCASLTVGLTIYNKTIKQLRKNDKYISSISLYENKVNSFNEQAGALYNHQNYVQYIKKNEDCFDMRCFDDVIIILKDISYILNFEKNITSFDTYKKLGELNSNIFNEKVVVNRLNVVEVYSKILSFYVENSYIEYKINEIDNFQYYENYNEKFIKLTLLNGTYIDMPEYVYSILKKHYPNLEKTTVK